MLPETMTPREAKVEWARRDALKAAGLALAATFLSGGCSSEANKESSGMPVVRISRITCNPADFEKVSAAMDESQRTLVPAIKELRGLLHYWAGADPATNSLTNVSVWATLADAQQMDTLAPMLESAKQLLALGVTFDRPIQNYATLWKI